MRLFQARSFILKCEFLSVASRTHFQTLRSIADECGTVQRAAFCTFLSCISVRGFQKESLVGSTMYRFRRTSLPTGKWKWTWGDDDEREHRNTLRDLQESVRLFEKHDFSWWQEQSELKRFRHLTRQTAARSLWDPDLPELKARWLELRIRASVLQRLQGVVDRFFWQNFDDRWSPSRLRTEIRRVVRLISMVQQVEFTCPFERTELRSCLQTVKYIYRDARRRRRDWRNRMSLPLR